MDTFSLIKVLDGRTPENRKHVLGGNKSACLIDAKIYVSTKSFAVKSFLANTNFMAYWIFMVKFAIRDLLLVHLFVTLITFPSHFVSGSILIQHISSTSPYSLIHTKLLSVTFKSFLYWISFTLGGRNPESFFTWICLLRSHVLYA